MRYIQDDELLELVEKLGLEIKEVNSGCEWGIACWKQYEIGSSRKVLLTVTDDGEVILEPSGERLDLESLQKLLKELRE